MARQLKKFCVTGFFACGGSRSVASSFPLQCNSRKAFFDSMEASEEKMYKKVVGFPCRNRGSVVKYQQQK